MSTTKQKGQYKEKPDGNVGEPTIVESSTTTDCSNSSNSRSSGGSSSTSSKYVDRMKKLRDLHTRRNEARKLNHVEVVEEDRRNKLPANYEARRRRQEWELLEIEKRKKADEEGEDYDRLKLLEVQADIADKVDQAKKRKKNPDQGFKDFETLSLRTYNRNTKNIKLDPVQYQAAKNAMGEEFYPTANTLIQGSHYPDKDSMDRMVEDLHNQKKKRMEYHRRRAFDPDARVDYINERNKLFNQKVERYYGQYTEEIKQSLERGTAI